MPTIPTGPAIPRHFLSLLSEGDPQPFTKGSGRLELAEAIVEAARSPSESSSIGSGRDISGPASWIRQAISELTGERPTNPELLEYLAQLLRRQRNVGEGSSARRSC